MRLLLTCLVAATLALTGCMTAKTPPEPVAAAPAAAPAPAPAPVIGDSDNDGVLDDVDKCPNTRAGVEVDANGCEILLRLEGVLFDFDKSDLKPEGRQVLMNEIPVLNRNPAKQLEIAGHTDSVGTDDYNDKLGARRATTVRDFLAANGVDRNRMSVVSYGENRPIADNETDAGQALNRRVEVVDLSK